MNQWTDEILSTITVSEITYYLSKLNVFSRDQVTLLLWPKRADTSGMMQNGSSSIASESSLWKVQIGVWRRGKRSRRPATDRGGNAYLVAVMVKVAM